ncbi:MAG: YbaB/EbfC family nucleoid-associated protein [Actinobacteria bacterium]|nr:YbaB/EbfC family nucleoid-associated protein [Actinomycetota bacterium]
MTEFNFAPPADDADEPGPTRSPDPTLIGTAESEDGRIQAVISQDGRLRELHLAPEVLSRGRDGTVMDSATLADKITRTVNAAMDDLLDRYRQTAQDDFVEVQAQLAATAEDFQRELGQISADILRAKQRLQEP